MTPAIHQHANAVLLNIFSFYLQTPRLQTVLNYWLHMGQMYKWSRITSTNQLANLVYANFLVPSSYSLPEKVFLHEEITVQCLSGCRRWCKDTIINICLKSRFSAHNLVTTEYHITLASDVRVIEGGQSVHLLFFEQEKTGRDTICGWTDSRWTTGWKYWSTQIQRVIDRWQMDEER